MVYFNQKGIYMAKGIFKGSTNIPTTSPRNIVDKVPLPKTSEGK